MANKADVAQAVASAMGYDPGPTRMQRVGSALRAAYRYQIVDVKERKHGPRQYADAQQVTDNESTSSVTAGYISGLRKRSTIGKGLLNDVVQLKYDKDDQQNNFAVIKTTLIKVANAFNDTRNDVNQIKRDIVAIDRNLNLKINSIERKLNEQLNAFRRDMARERQKVDALLRNSPRAMSAFGNRPIGRPAGPVGAMPDYSGVPCGGGSAIGNALSTYGAYAAAGAAGRTAWSIARARGIGGVAARGGIVAGLDWASGLFGVGGHKIDHGQDSRNWSRFNWWQKAESGFARGIEGIGGYITPNWANQARAGRIQQETEYLRRNSGGAPMTHGSPAHQSRAGTMVQYGRMAGSVRHGLSADDSFYRNMIEAQKARFLGYGQLPPGFESMPGHNGILGSPSFVRAAGAMPIGGYAGQAGGSNFGGSYGGGGSFGGFSGGRSSAGGGRRSSYSGGGGGSPSYTSVPAGVPNNAPSRSAAPGGGTYSAPVQGGRSSALDGPSGQRPFDGLNTSSPENVVDRSRFAAEFADPGFRRRMIALGKIEVGGQKWSDGSQEKAFQAWLETPANRALAVGAKTVGSRLDGRNHAYWGGGIGNPNSVTEAELKRYGPSFDAVAKGSNLSKWATDNASGAFIRGRIASGIAGHGSYIGNNPNQEWLGVTRASTGHEKWHLSQKAEYERRIAAGEVGNVYKGPGVDYSRYGTGDWSDGREDIRKQMAATGYSDNRAAHSPAKAAAAIPAGSTTGSNASEWAQKYTRTQTALGITPQQYDVYRRSVGQIESGNNPNQGAGGARGHYWGPYQFGALATESTNKLLGENVSRTQFKGNQDLAERHFDALSYLSHKELMQNSPKYQAMSPQEKLAVLGYAHNQGAGMGQQGSVVGASRWLETGKAGADGFGTGGTKYYNSIRQNLTAAQNSGSASQGQPKVTTDGKHAIIAMGTNDYRDSSKVHGNVTKIINQAKAQGLTPIVVPPNPNDPRFKGAHEQAVKAANDAGARVHMGEYGAKDPLHLTQKSAAEIRAQYPGISIGDSNATRIQPGPYNKVGAGTSEIARMYGGSDVGAGRSFGGNSSAAAGPQPTQQPGLSGPRSAPFDQAGGVAFMNSRNRVGANLSQVDPALLHSNAEAIRVFEEKHGGRYMVDLLGSGGGKRGAGGSFHSSGQAMDLVITDMQTGRRLSNFPGYDRTHGMQGTVGENAHLYQDLFNGSKIAASKFYPEKATQMRWGGYGAWGDNEFDTMHNDWGMRKGMGGGTWEGGFSQQFMNKYRIKENNPLGTDMAGNIARQYPGTGSGQYTGQLPPLAIKDRGILGPGAGQSQQGQDRRAFFSTDGPLSKQFMSEKIGKYGGNLDFGGNIDTPDQFQKFMGDFNEMKKNNPGLRSMGYSFGPGAPQGSWGNNFPEEQAKVRELAKSYNMSPEQWYAGGWMTHMEKQFSDLKTKGIVPDTHELDNINDGNTAQALMGFQAMRSKLGINTQLNVKNFGPGEFNTVQQLIKEGKVPKEMFSGLNIVEGKYINPQQAAQAGKPLGFTVGNLPGANQSSYGTGPEGLPYRAFPSGRAPAPQVGQTSPLTPGVVPGTVIEPKTNPVLSNPAPGGDQTQKSQASQGFFSSAKDAVRNWWNSTPTSVDQFRQIAQDKIGKMQGAPPPLANPPQIQGAGIDQQQGAKLFGDDASKLPGPMLPSQTQAPPGGPQTMTPDATKEAVTQAQNTTSGQQQQAEQPAAQPTNNDSVPSTQPGGETPQQGSSDNDTPPSFGNHPESSSPEPGSGGMGSYGRCFV